MNSEDPSVVFEGVVRLHNQAIPVHGILRIQGTKGTGHVIFPPGNPPELGRYYPLTLRDGTRLEIIIDDREDDQALVTVLDASLLAPS